MSICIKSGVQLTPCENLALGLGAVNLDTDQIAVGTIAVFQTQNEEGTVVRDDVFTVSTQGDNIPVIFKYCPFCGTEIGNYEE